MHACSSFEKEARSIEDAGCLGHYQTVLVRTSKSKNPYYGKNGEFTDTWYFGPGNLWLGSLCDCISLCCKFGLMEGLTVSHLTRKSSNMTCLCGTGNAKNSWNMCSQISLSWRAMAWPSTAFGWRSWRVAPLAVQTCQEYLCATLAWRILLPLPPDTHTHKFVGICMLPFNVLKCVGSGTSINPVWIKKDVFRIKHPRLRIKTSYLSGSSGSSFLLVLLVLPCGFGSLGSSDPLFFWSPSIAQFDGKNTVLARTTKYVRSTLKFPKMISFWSLK